MGNVGTIEIWEILKYGKYRNMGNIEVGEILTYGPCCNTLLLTHNNNQTCLNMGNIEIEELGYGPGCNTQLLAHNHWRYNQENILSYSLHLLLFYCQVVKFLSISISM